MNKIIYRFWAKFSSLCSPNSVLHSRHLLPFSEYSRNNILYFFNSGNGISTRRAPIMYKYSGGEAPKKILARGSDVWFKFTSSLAIARKGFKAIITERPISGMDPSSVGIHRWAQNVKVSFLVLNIKGLLNFLEHKPMCIILEHKHSMVRW